MHTYHERKQHQIYKAIKVPILGNILRTESEAQNMKILRNEILNYRPKWLVKRFYLREPLPFRYQQIFAPERRAKRRSGVASVPLRRRVATAPERSPISLRSKANLAPERRVVVSLRSGFAPARFRCRSGAEGDAAPERRATRAAERARSGA